MSPLLLKTKLHIPPVRADSVRRGRLFECLEAGLKCKLTLLSAPAGFGKTTLLSGWLSERQLPVAWLSLEPEDNVFARFWFYLVAALQTIDAALAESMLPALRSPQPPPMETFLTSLIEELRLVTVPFVLVLDNFQAIEDAQIQDGLLFLLEHQPPGMHLVLSTRADPPWPLARFRAGGEMVEIRVDDLRFSAEETAEFMNFRMGLGLAAEDVALLDEHTEGWIAGLQLAVLSMQGQPDKAAFIRAFSGSHRFILDYLVEEVLDQQPAERREFLLKTSLLSRMNAPLCDALLQQNNSRAILKQLEEANLFLIPLDDERRWYRYHPLFAEMLRGTLSQESASLVPELHRRASQWYARYGMLPEAVSQAFMAGEAAYVAQLIEENALMAVMIFNEHLPALVGWMNALPEALQRSRPWLALGRAWVLAYAGELDAAEAIVLEIEQTLSALPEEPGARVLHPQHLAGYLAAIRGYCHFMKGESRGAAERMCMAGPLLPETDVLARVFTAIVLAASKGLEGDLEGGLGVLSEALRFESEAQSPLLAILVLCEVAGLQILAGRLTQVIATCQQALQLAQDYERLMGVAPPHIGFAHTRLSYALREQNDLQGAVRHAQEGARISRNWGQKDSLCISYTYLAYAYQAAGSSAEAIRMIQNARQVSRTVSSSFDAHTAAYEAQLHARLDQTTLLLRWREESGLSCEEKLPFRRLREYLVYARALLVEGSLPACQALLGRILENAGAAGSRLYRIEASILQALAFQAQGELQQAKFLLVQALSLGESEGYVRLFVDEGLPIRPLLQAAARSGPSSIYAARLLEVLASESQTADRFGAEPSPQAPSELRSLLTARELEILRLLSAPQSIPQIAAELCIETSTLRTHLRNIYDKLGVHSRLEAVARSTQENTSSMV